jgi:hypothetical protein
VAELQEVSENMFLCATEGGHLSTGGRSAQHRDEGHNKQFSKVVPGVAGTRIGDFVEGGEKNLHRARASRAGCCRPRIHVTSERKGLRSTFSPNAIPLFFLQAPASSVAAIGANIA